MSLKAKYGQTIKPRFTHELSAAFVSFIIANWRWCALASISVNER